MNPVPHLHDTHTRNWRQKNRVDLWCWFLEHVVTGVCNVDSSSESDDADDNFYSMSDVRRRNAGHQWQDRIQRQSRLCVTLSISKGRVLACTASQVYIALS